MEEFGSFRTTVEDNENGPSSFEYSTKRNITTVKIKLGATSVVSILKKKDDSSSDEPSMSKNRISYTGLVVCSFLRIFCR
ncbi:unnamed protein product [Gongylonema pulchrum]|uniref:Uncharacterized protein n=1 Tax=Gongylonema pulchrum TaxID=637853 RepID=A0A183DHC7_9BILA|nr:unnamed protein product [Gongylonema pulchrum]